MNSANFLGYVALGVALLGLAAVLLEAAAKDPRALLDIMLDARRAAAPDAQARQGKRVTIGYDGPRPAANDLVKAA